MIHYLEHKNIDKVKWDQCISNSQNPIIYAFSWYLDYVCNEWNALIEDDYDSVFPLTNRNKFGIDYLYQPCFTQQLGLFSKEKISNKIIEEFISKIPDKYKIIEINLNIANNINTLKDYNIIRNSTYHLNLNRTYEDIYKDYSTNTKRNIKKATEAGITITQSENPDKIINLFKNNRGKDLDTLKQEDYNILAELTAFCLKYNYAEIFEAYNKDKTKLLSGMIILRGFNKCIFIFSANSNEGKDCCCMPYLIDSFIKNNAGQNLIFDFEGSNNPSLARFYKGFGSEEKIYLQLKRNQLSFGINKLNSFYKLIKSRLKKIKLRK